MQDDPNRPIMVSEVPPRRQPSAMSFFSRLDRSRSAISESSSHKPKTRESSPSKNLTQTMIEKWVHMASGQRYENVVDAPDDLLPPWVSPIRPVQRNTPQSIELSSVIKDEESFADDNSDCSLPEIIDQTGPQLEEYSIQANDEYLSLSLSSEPEDASEAYRTPRHESSPANSLSSPSPDIFCSPLEDFYPEVAPEPYKTFRDNNSDTDSQATIQYDSQSDDSQYNMQENMLHENEVRNLSNSRKVAPYAYNSDFQPSTSNDSQVDVNIPESYNSNENQTNTETSSPTNSSRYEDAEENTSKTSSPILLLSPVNDAEIFQHHSPPHKSSDSQDRFFENLLFDASTETKSIESYVSSSRKQYLQCNSDTESSSQIKPASKLQKLNKDEKKGKGKHKESSSTRLVQSQEATKLNRLEHKPLKSTLKTPKTIETYFSNSLGTSQEGELDIGRESVPPSYGYLNTDAKKEDIDT
ncbi:hypothetical protein INT47_004197 [Mucor saturninus]|uniref:Uncharacterized protein n=1 Tax=Mucor saturninus TaxID=64648 RepID=A0A8H7QQW6_9FUNG|nr:hypothetical protein INT47_004197 [Mucor saturninus]